MKCLVLNMCCAEVGGCRAELDARSPGRRSVVSVVAAVDRAQNRGVGSRKRRVPSGRVQWGSGPRRTQPGERPTSLSFATWPRMCRASHPFRSAQVPRRASLAVGSNYSPDEEGAACCWTDCAALPPRLLRALVCSAPALPPAALAEMCSPSCTIMLATTHDRPNHTPLPPPLLSVE